MRHIKSEDPFESFEEKGAESGCDNSGSSMDFYLWDKFIQRKKDEKSQCEGNKILNKEIVYKRDEFRIDIIGDKGTFLYRSLDGCPGGCDEERDQHENSDGEHNDVFHDTVVEEGFLVVCLEDEIYGVDQVRKQKASGDKRPSKPEPPQVGDILGEIPDLLDKVGVELSEKFFREDVKTLRGNFRISQNLGGGEGKESDERYRTKNGEIRDRNSEVSTSVLGKFF